MKSDIVCDEYMYRVHFIHCSSIATNFYKKSGFPNEKIRYYATCSMHKHHELGKRVKEISKEEYVVWKVMVE